MQIPLKVLKINRLLPWLKNKRRLIKILITVKIKHTLNPNWGLIKIIFLELTCGADYTLIFLIKIWLPFNNKPPVNDASVVNVKKISIIINHGIYITRSYLSANITYFVDFDIVIIKFLNNKILRYFSILTNE